MKYTLQLLLISLSYPLYNSNELSTDLAPVILYWYAPFLSGGGYSSEAFSMIKSLKRIDSHNKVEAIPRHHGDSINQNFVSGLNDEDYEVLRSIYALRPKSRMDASKRLISVCHSEPGAWHAPLPK